MVYLLDEVSNQYHKEISSDVINKYQFKKVANYAQTECQFRYCGTAIPFLTVRSTAR